MNEYQIKLSLTKSNLSKLKAYWEENSDRVELNMSSFGGISRMLKQDYDPSKKHICGSVCCILGLAPEILRVDLILHFDSDNEFCYDSFAKTHFPSLYDGRGVPTSDWIYLFDVSWEDNLSNALKRIKEYIDKA